ncbi:hypothetical protein AAL_03850 [Moelleriella libera RCEF 2490]|uniref:Uncharacterized protein n=1 Tax=Moelleriella libera RCEF 2490 TaxID=1081109 RepID=A0A168CHU1_9HYPO|nr:hypothetical protein AAL_03850 [Moelleriella libera RCEF 2490]
MLDNFLQTIIFYDINRALKAQNGKPQIIQGDLCPTKDLKPDWALIDYDQATKSPSSFLAGETKLGWRAKVGDEPWLTEDEWQKPIYQTAKYMIASGTRYGYIITDIELVVLRLAMGTSDRPVTRGAVASGGGAALEEAPYYRIRYKRILWGTNGQGQMTVKLALWFLAMMARNGDRKIEASYPPINTWRLTNGEYVHCLTGKRKKKLGRGDSLIK